MGLLHLLRLHEYKPNTKPSGKEGALKRGVGKVLGEGLNIVGIFPTVFSPTVLREEYLHDRGV